jgi:short-subunit dehydrogenase
MKIKKALVTGGTSGIGLALCEELLQLGVEVYSVSRNPKKIEPQTKFHQLTLDLSDLNSVSQFGDEFIDQYGMPDLLINNAGYGAFYEWKEFPQKEIENQINVLFTAPTLLCKSFAPLMATDDKGVIVNITSLATLYPLPFMPLYNAGKSALSSFSQSMMLEYCDYPRWIDYRLGDICTGFNQSAPKQKTELQSEVMKNAWLQIEKQLNESPSAISAAKQMIKYINKERSCTVYGGSFFQAFLAPFFYRFLQPELLLKILRYRYK